MPRKVAARPFGPSSMAVGTGEALAREQRGQQPVHRRLARVERLRHRPERLLEAGRLRACDAERVGEPAGVESEQLARRGGGAEVPEHAGDVPAAIGERAAEDAADARLDLEAGDEGAQRLGAGRRDATRRARARRARRAPRRGRSTAGACRRSRARATGRRWRALAMSALVRSARPTTVACGSPPAGADHRRQRRRQRLGGAADGRAEPVGHRAARRLRPPRAAATPSPGRARSRPAHPSPASVHDHVSCVSIAPSQPAPVSARAHDAAVHAQHLAGHVAGSGRGEEDAPPPPRPRDGRGGPSGSPSPAARSARA